MYILTFIWHILWLRATSRFCRLIWYFDIVSGKSSHVLPGKCADISSTCMITYITTFLSCNLFDILADIISETFSGVPSGIYSDFLLGILSNSLFRQILCGPSLQARENLLVARSHSICHINVRIYVRSTVR